MKMIDNQQRINKLKRQQYQAIFGVLKETFDKMLEVLESAYQELHKQGGKPPKLSVLDKLIITLMYWREYRTFEHIAFDYDVCKSTICESVHWVENELKKCKDFALPSKRELQKNSKDIEVIVVDVTEQEIERPKQGQKKILLRQEKETYD